MVKWCCFGAESEPVHIYGHMLSPPSRSVVAFVNLVGIPHEFHVVDLPAKAQFSPEFTKINPFQSVPALVHGSFNAWESCALIIYLADTFRVNSSWYPQDLKIRARINAYFLWHQTNTNPSVAGYVGAKFFKPNFQGAPQLTPEEERPLKKRLDEYFQDLIWLIRETGYVARTQQPTIADVFCYSDLASLLFIGFDFGIYPEVKVWFDKIGANKPVAQAHETLRGIVQSMSGKGK